MNRSWRLYNFVFQTAKRSKTDYWNQHAMQLFSSSCVATKGMAGSAATEGAAVEELNVEVGFLLQLLLFSLFTMS